MVKTLLLTLLTTTLINNVVLSQFLGLCPFLGVSKSIKTAAGMGAAVIFVITLSSALTSLIYTGVLVPLELTYLETIVFILVIAALVQLVEMALKKPRAVCGTGGVSAPHHHQLRRAGRGADQRAERQRLLDERADRLRHGGGLCRRHRDYGGAAGEDGA